MLRRLGLVKEVNGENGHSSEEAAAAAASRAQTHVTAPSVDPHLNSRYFKVVYRGAVAVRSNPAEPAPEVGQVSKRINTHIAGTDRQHSSSYIILQLLRILAVCTIGGEITGRSFGLWFIFEEGRSSQHTRSSTYSVNAMLRCASLCSALSDAVGWCVRQLPPVTRSCVGDFMLVDTERHLQRSNWYQVPGSTR